MDFPGPTPKSFYQSEILLFGGFLRLKINPIYTPVNWHGNGISTLWRCISYWKGGFSIAMLVYQRVQHERKHHHTNLLLLRRIVSQNTSSQGMTRHFSEDYWDVLLVRSKWINYNPFISRLGWIHPVNRWNRPTYDHDRYDHFQRDTLVVGSFNGHPIVCASQIESRNAKGLVENFSVESLPVGIYGYPPMPPQELRP